MGEICRFCSAKLKHTFCDLGSTPPANAYLKTISQKEQFYPLHAYICDKCYLVQLGDFQTPVEIFSDYAYFSSYSDSWVEHAKKYAEQMISRFSFNSIVEIASNDGYLLQHFKGMPILGIEPAQNVAEVAKKRGIPTLTKFFSLATAKELVAANQRADLLIANNVLAHVPQLNDFVAGMKVFLAPEGILTIEVPHLLQLIRENQFDTIYHEHFSYFSLLSVEKICAGHELELFDVEELSTHGGSLRIYLQHKGGRQKCEKRVDELRQKEAEISSLDACVSFQSKVKQIKQSLTEFLKQIKQEGKSVAGYGAPAKGNTLLNYCGISTALLPFTVDRNPHKQGCFLPGTRIPIYSPSKIDEVKPDYLLILPWNWKDEIMDQMAHIRNWGAQFVVPIPELRILA